MSSADLAFIFVCTGLVFIMTPGLALFYGGLLRKKNMLSMMGMCWISIVVVSILWFIAAYSLAFAPDAGAGFVGGLDFIGLNKVSIEPYDVYTSGIPHLLFMAFQLMFAIITVAIVASPFADRVKFRSFVIFIAIWLFAVYAPISHWVWGDGGFLGAIGALDFAGGTVVHINAGFTALAVALVIGPRKGYQDEAFEPSNIPFVLLGTGLLWLGWFGFNGGSALAANGIAVLAMFNTHLAASAAALVWLTIDWFRTGKAGTLGIVTGGLAGLVAVTPAAGFITPSAALVIGIVVAIVCYIAFDVRNKSSIDESLDAWAVHGIGGIWGALATGIFASVGATGLILGNAGQLWIQLIGVVVTIVYAFGVSLAIALAIKYTIGLKVSEEEEYVGLDISQHGEKAFT